MYSLIDRLTTSGGGCQEFTSSGVFVVPEGVHKIWITACGAGASGSSYGGDSTVGYSGGAGGNGGEAIVKLPFNVEPNLSIAITIGVGGASVSSGVGKAGGNTIIENLITLLGGPAATDVDWGNATGRPGAGRGGLGASIEVGTAGEDGIIGKGGQGGGNVWCYYYDAADTTSMLISSGTRWVSHASHAGGGGGGSLGNGGNGMLYAYMGPTKGYQYYKATAGVKGGGGGGGLHVTTGSSSAGTLVTYYASGKGGDGYVFIEW